jgi:hypothetical protein
MIVPTSPIWPAKLETNTFSVAVRVSDEELANSASSWRAISSDWRGSATLITYQLTSSLP